MKKQMMLVLCLLLSAMLLCSCAQKDETEAERYQVLGQVTQSAVIATDVPVSEPDPVVTDAPVIDWDNTDYDPSQEEGGDSEPVADVAAPQATDMLTMNSQYAGASPVVIDPIDKPTPSPVPNLSITAFSTYDALELGLSFEAPAGWIADSSVTGSFTITNPDTSTDAQAFMTIQAESVASKYSKTQMATAVKNAISALKSSGNYSSVSSTNTADRTLLDSNGVYADYTATTSTGAKVYGRFHVANVGTKIYTVHLEYPYAYKDTYKTALYNKMRSTIKITK